jgi:hypothetical protein
MEVLIAPKITEKLRVESVKDNPAIEEFGKFIPR